MRSDHKGLFIVVFARSDSDEAMTVKGLFQ